MFSFWWLYWVRPNKFVQFFFFVNKAKLKNLYYFNRNNILSWYYLILDNTWYFTYESLFRVGRWAFFIFLLNSKYFNKINNNLRYRDGIEIRKINIEFFKFVIKNKRQHENEKQI